MHGIIYCYISRWGTVPRNVIDGLQPLESNQYQVEFDPARRELVSTCEKNKSPSKDHNKLTLKLVS